MDFFDVTFIGGGPAGYTGAIRASQLGKSVLLIEKSDIGGVCLNRGCIPTKTLISSIHAGNTAKKGKDLGLYIPDVEFRYNDILKRRDMVVAGSRNGLLSLLKKWNIHLKKGIAHLTASDHIEILPQDGKKENIRSENIVIATGSLPANIPGINTGNIGIWNSDSLNNMETLPGSLIIVGGGAIGCEYAYIFNSLGVDVSIIEMEPHILPQEDTEIANIVEREFKKKKIKLFTGNAVKHIDKNGTSYSVKLLDGKGIGADNIIVSVGRVPCGVGLGLEDIGVKVEGKGTIPVNEKMETEVKGVYAAGDVTGKYLLAYVAEHEGIIVSENIAGADRRMIYDHIPRVVFSDPEVGSVGVTQKEADARGIDIKIGRFHYRGLARSHAAGKVAGMVKVICDTISDKIIGVHITGEYASEIVHLGVMAMRTGMTSANFGDTMFAHPVFSETLLEAVWDINGRSIHKI